MHRNCVSHPDNFCYVCGVLTFKSQRRHFTPLIKKCYEQYFGCKVEDQDKIWAPHMCCVTCVRFLTAWTKGSRHVFCNPYGLERTQRSQFRLLLLNYKYKRYNLKV